MRSLIYKELVGIFGGWSTWIVLILFFVSITAALWWVPGYGYREYGYASTGLYFDLAAYLLLFLVPGITFGIFSSERRNGTLEVLFSLPIGKWQILISKYLACLVFVLLVALLSIPSIYVVQDLRLIAQNELGQILGSYAGLILIGSLFTAIGIFASSLTDNPALAFISAIILSFFLYDILYLLGDSADASGGVFYWLKKLSLRHHMEYWSQGIVTASGIVYMLSWQILFLAGSRLNLSKIDSR